MINETDLSAWEYYDQPPLFELSQYLVLGRDNCSYCDKAKKLLTDLGFKFDYRDILSISLLDRQNLEEIAGDPFRTVPQIFTYNMGGALLYIGGYNELISSLL